MIAPLDRASETVTALRLRRRARRAAPARQAPPERPVGVKLELTHRCNLRCGFCYTDSPRRTLERVTDMPEHDWLRIADEVVELGAIEAVVTGGEPLLRRDLALDVVTRLGTSGMSVTLNTNGWFVEDSVADRLATVPGLRMHVSIDGAAPEVHDAARGVPGSWRRAVRAVALLLDRGVTVLVAHVVTPENQASFEGFLELMWTLGVGAVRVTPVAPIGAATDAGDWSVDERRLAATAARFREGHGDGPAVRVVSEGAGVQTILSQAPPTTLLVRPLGAVLTDSLHPFAYGDARTQSLRECWDAIAANWRSPQVARWAAAMRTPAERAQSPLVPYRDGDVPVTPGASTIPSHSASELEPRRLGPVADFDTGAARAHAAELALARPYRLAPVRWSGDRDGERYVRVIRTGHVTRLNRASSIAMDALDGGTPADALARLRERYPGVAESRLTHDALAAARLLARRAIVQPALALRDMPDTPPAESVSELPAVAG